MHKHATGAAAIELREVAVERGLAWADSQELWAGCKSSDEGYYVTNSENARKTGVLLAIGDNSAKSFSKQVFRIYKPNTGLQSKTETLSSLKEKAKKVNSDEAEKHWERIHQESYDKCSHEIWLGKCSRKNNGHGCDVGLRKRIYHLLSGSVLSVWETIEKTMPSHLQSKLQIIRLKHYDEVKKKDVRVIGKLLLKHFNCSIMLINGLLLYQAHLYRKKQLRL